MNTKKIIAFSGRKRSGKGAICNEFVKKYNAKVITIANYLKNLCCELINCDYDILNIMKDDGTTFNYTVDERWVDIINNKTKISKDDIIKVIGDIEFTSVRQMLQVIGTDLIRKYNINWHCEMMLNEMYKSENDLIVIDDVRFENEKTYIENIGGIVFFIIRPDYDDISNHESEYSLSWRNFKKDTILINDKSLSILIKKVFSIYENHNKFKCFKYFDDYQDNKCNDIKLLYYKVSNPENKWYNPYLAEDLKLYL